jgi:hypothetical protein
VPVPLPAAPSGVLVDQTMLADAARLLQNVPEGQAFVGYLVDAGFDPILAGPLADNQRRTAVTRIDRLADLSAVCDALLLYDKLYVLRSETFPDADRLVLRSALADLGILEELDVGAHGPAIADELVGFLSTSEPDAAPRLLADVAAVVRGALVSDDEPAEYDRTTTMIDAFRDGAESVLGAPVAAGTDPLTAVGRRLVADVRYFGSGSMFGAVSDIRTFVYWRLSARLQLPMYPSSRRLPSYQAITRHVDRSLREQAYDAVAEAFRTTVAEVYEGDARTPIYLPPGLTIFLDTMREHRSVPASIVELRRRSQPLRDAFRKLQEDTSRSRTIGQLHRHRLRFAEVLDALRTPDGARSAGLETAIDLLPEVAQAAANPLDLSAYGENLIRKPAEWIQNWWRQRPYRVAFDLRERLLEVADYTHLLQDVTGVRITADDLRAYAAVPDAGAQIPPVRRPGPVGPSPDRS